MILLVIAGVALSTIGGSVVAMVLHGDISANEGVINTFKALISPGKNSIFVIILGFLVSFGVMDQVSSWIVSPTAGLRFVATKGLLPSQFKEVNKKGVLVKLLIVQGFVVTFWAAVLTFGSGGAGGNVSFQTAISLTVIIYLSAYILFFIVYFVVVFKKKNLERDYQIKGGTLGKVIVAGVGLLISILAVISAFIIPNTMSAQDGKTYIMTLIICFVITIALPFLFYDLYSKKHKKENMHKKEDTSNNLE